MNVFIVLSMLGNMYASLHILLLSFSEIYTETLTAIFFFLTSTTFEENGLFDGQIAPASSIPLKYCLTSSYIAGRIHLCGSLMEFHQWALFHAQLNLSCLSL